VALREIDILFAWAMALIFAAELVALVVYVAWLAGALTMTGFSVAGSVNLWSRTRMATIHEGGARNHVGGQPCSPLSDRPNVSPPPMPATGYAGRRGLVHGLSAEFLADKFLAFVGDGPLVAHNTGFDIAFLNAELTARAIRRLLPSA
jgi:hypothetical protein